MNNSSNDLYIIGAGGLGREMAALLFSDKAYYGYSFSGFIDDGFPAKKDSGGFPITGEIKSLINRQPANLLLGIGNPATRKKLFEKLNGLSHNFPVIIAATAQIHNTNRIQIGEGCYIADGCVLTTDIQIGKFCILLPCTTISHDTVIGDFCTLMPGVRITSGATIGNNVYIGAGAIIAKPVSIADGEKIAAGTIIA